MPTQTSVSGADRGRGPGHVSPRAVLERARDELRANTIQGSGGRAALERYTAHVDRLLRHLSEAAAEDRTAAVFALGGTAGGICASTRTSICWCCSRRPIGTRRGGVPPRRFCIRCGTWAVSSSGTRCGSCDEFEQLETDNPEFLLALLDARPVAGRASCSSRFGARFTRPGTHAFILTSLLELIEQRHAQFNGDAVSAGAGREGGAGGAARFGGDADDRAADRPAAAAAGAGRPGAVR